MEKLMKYYIVQKKKNGKWVNHSCRFFIKGLTGALKCYRYLKMNYPNDEYRIAKGKAVLDI